MDFAAWGFDGPKKFSVLLMAIPVLMDLRSWIRSGCSARSGVCLGAVCMAVMARWALEDPAYGQNEYDFK